MAAVVRRNPGRTAAAVRALVELGREMLRRQAADRALRPREALATILGRRHPLSPAAIRVERSRVRDERGSGDQTALTVWFGDPPQLPGPAAPAMNGGLSVRTLLGGALGIAGMVALGALGVIANQRETQRLAEPRTVPRLGH